MGATLFWWSHHGRCSIGWKAVSKDACRHDFIRGEAHLIWQDLFQLICGEISGNKMWLGICNNEWIVLSKVFDFFVAQHFLFSDCILSAEMMSGMFSRCWVFNFQLHFLELYLALSKLAFLANSVIVMSVASKTLALIIFDLTPNQSMGKTFEPHVLNKS